MTVSPNRMARIVSRLDLLPARARTFALSQIFGRMVKLAGTARLEWSEVSPERVEVRIANRSSVQNHIGGVHAAAMALVAETATGFALGMHLPDGKLPLIKSMKVDYLRRARGGLSAVAALRAEQIETILREPKGEVLVPVTVKDESGEEPIRCEMLWAWVPKR
jgi:acyl-coenzyme A thioesterase PaaI-like protein